MIEIYIGGAYNPLFLNVVSYSFIIYKNKNKIYEEFDIVEYEKNLSSNSGRYIALFKALQWIIENQIKNEKIIIKYDDTNVTKEGMKIQLIKILTSSVKNLNKISFLKINKNLNIANGLARKAYKEYYIKNKEVVKNKILSKIRIEDIEALKNIENLKEEEKERLKELGLIKIVLGKPMLTHTGIKILELFKN